MREKKVPAEMGVNLDVEGQAMPVVVFAGGRCC